MNKDVEKLTWQLGGRQGDLFYLCHSGAEAVCAVLFSHYFEEVRSSGKNHLLVSNVEDAATHLFLERLEALHCVGKRIGVDSNCQILPEAVEEAIHLKTSLLSFSWAHPLTGVVQRVSEIVKVCRKKGIRVHVDVSAILQQIDLSSESIDLDYMSWGGEALGIEAGGILMKKEIPFSPLILGEGRGDGKKVASLREGFSQIGRRMDDFTLENARLRDLFEARLEEGLADVQVLFKQVERLCHFSVVAFAGVHSQALLFLLQQQGIDAEIGGEREQLLERILVGCGYDPVLSKGALRFSIPYAMEEEAVLRMAEKIVASVKKLRGCSFALFHEGVL
ncbi:MAG: aminotransferase class V-fold PLP-dependent enzyme [Chlamydiales bacterium]|nr:aminotransferase class V-fold PLP-dependent enzyme [Chlamydiales bacterium]